MKEGKPTGFIFWDREVKQVGTYQTIVSEENEVEVFTKKKSKLLSHHNTTHHHTLQVIHQPHDTDMNRPSGGTVI
jgi:hypothetical protein